MTQRTQKVWIGIFVLGGLVATGVLILKFGYAVGILRQSYIVNAVYEKVIGVREGMEVTLAGIQVGRVKQVDLKDRSQPNEGAVVAMEIQSKFTIPSGSTAEMIQPIMGQPTININPPAVITPPVPQNGTALLKGVQLNPLGTLLPPEMMTKVATTTVEIGQLAAALTPAANDLHELMQKRTVEQIQTQPATGPAGQERLTANLYTAVERLQNVLAHLDAVIGDPAVQSNFKDTLTNLRAASEDARQAAAGFRSFSDQAKQTATKADGVLTKLDATIDDTHKNIEELGKSLLANSDRMAKMLDNFVLASRDMATGQGTIGMLLRDPKFYEELLLTVRRLKEATTDLQALIRTWQKEGLLGAR